MLEFDFLGLILIRVGFVKIWIILIWRAIMYFIGNSG